MARRDPRRPYFLATLFLCSACATIGSQGPPAPEEPATPPRRADPTEEPAPVWGEGRGKNYYVPVADIIGFQFVLNQYDREFASEDDYDSDLSSIERNLKHAWVIDNDPFATNQFLHPYQGSMYHGFARSAGLNYWEALAYDFGGSALWEVAGETVPPSLNDQITTTFGGSFLGEVLFRMASVVLEENAAKPGFWRELGAALISPATGFNRLAWGERFDGVYDSRRAATYYSAGVGARRNANLEDLVALGSIQRDVAVANFSMDYGLPGQPGYEYTRPFDYFHFETTLTSSSNAIPENVMVRGLLFGSDYTWGNSYRGIWGLYGSYDYISPELFSVSSTALSLGTTGQWWLSDSVALQGTALGGVGWTAVGTLADASVDRDYAYGYSPEALVETRLLFGNVAMFEVSGRKYILDGKSSTNGSSQESIARGQVGVTVRIYGHHALAIQFVASSRDADLFDLSNTLQSVGALSIYYTYLSSTKFGAVGWGEFGDN
jgi:hypothetical protein